MAPNGPTCRPGNGVRVRTGHEWLMVRVLFLVGGLPPLPVGAGFGLEGPSLAAHRDHTDGLYWPEMTTHVGQGKAYGSKSTTSGSWAVF